ncbi:hypothetical protein GCM10027160_00550 [Streptomyces calidiresistens]|uniref:CRISPR system ring nuclease SSO1393-like domain-containing protein n=1 Tax=Streptomyces calidiresistens TaxID=1485586 RepID=A0A7W3XV08_9ACTN|nr:hypothetical protein [Streptomyces calidiresistens]MBB0228323.1 hypothetical protein [Streptomyces calidiresistens]
MTVHIVSTGLTLCHFLGNRPGSHGLDPALAGEIRACRPTEVFGTAGAVDGQAAGALLSACTGPGPSDLRDRLTAMIPRIAPESWPETASAELTSLARTPDGRRLLPSSDMAVLLSTDTAEGLTAALWNAIALTGGDLDRIVYLDTPEQRPMTARGNAVVVRVPGLDARDQRSFSRAMQGLGTLGRHLHRGTIAPDEECRFHLSGGYKATVPFLLGLAEGIRSLPGAGPVTAYAVHETTSGDPIRLPLRRIPRSLIDPLIEVFAHRPVSWRAPMEDELEGYAYDRETEDPPRWRLNPFGAGLLALYGPPAEGMSP